MYTRKYSRYRRKSGAFTALWLTVLVLSVGLFGTGAGSQESDQAPAAGFSGALDPVAGVPSSTALNALPNWVRQSAEGVDEGDNPFATISAFSGDDYPLFAPFSHYYSPILPRSNHQISHTPRAPPFV